MGFIHGVIVLAFFRPVLMLLRVLSLLEQGILSLAALWIFVDTGTIAYLNSLYSDVPATLGGLVAVFIGAYLLSAERPSLSMLIVFSAAALLFITSKAQHGAPVTVLATLLC